MAHRMLRINELIKQELSQLLEQDVDILGMVNVVAVETTRDLATATVYLSSVDREPTKDLTERLNRAGYTYRQVLMKRLALKNIPVFTFIFDTHADAVNRVEVLLSQLEKETSGPVL